MRNVMTAGNIGPTAESCAAIPEAAQQIAEQREEYKKRRYIHLREYRAPRDISVNLDAEGRWLSHSERPHRGLRLCRRPRTGCARVEVLEVVTLPVIAQP